MQDKPGLPKAVSLAEKEHHNQSINAGCFRHSLQHKETNNNK